MISGLHSISLPKIRGDFWKKDRKIIYRNKVHRSIRLYYAIAFIIIILCSNAMAGAFSSDFKSWDKNGNNWVKSALKGYNVLDCVPTYQTITNTGSSPLTLDAPLEFDYTVSTSSGVMYGITGFYYCESYTPPAGPTQFCTGGSPLQSLSDNLPAYSTLTAPIFPSIKPTSSTKLSYVWHITDLPVDASVTLSYCAKLSNEVQFIQGATLQQKSSLPGGGTISMPCGGDVGAPDLTILKEGTPSCGKVTYTLTYSNSDASNSIAQTMTQISDTYEATKVVLDESSIIKPSGVTYSNSGGVITWNIGTLNPGASGTISYAMNLLPDVISGTVTNTAVISGYYGDRNPADNTATRTYSIQASPIIGTEPADQTVCIGATSVTFSVVASGPGTLTYQWYKGSGTSTPLIDGPTTQGSTIVGSTTSTLRIDNVVEGDEGIYHVRVTSNPGNCYADSREATLTVQGEPNPFAGPDQSMCVKDTLSLHGTGDGFDPLSAVWSLSPDNLGPGGTFVADPNHQDDPTYAIFDPSEVTGLWQDSILRFTVTGSSPCSSVTKYDDMTVRVYSKAEIVILPKAPMDP